MYNARVITPKNKTNNTVVKHIVEPKKKPKRKRNKKVNHKTITNESIDEFWMNKKKLGTPIEPDSTQEPTEHDKTPHDHSSVSVDNIKLSKTIIENKNGVLQTPSDYSDGGNQFSTQPILLALFELVCIPKLII